MQIDYSPLPHGPSSFKDGLEFFHDIKEWSTAYETRYMVPDKYNHQLAEETTRILLANVPGPFKATAKNVVSALMSDRLRKSMMYEDPPKIYPRTIDFIFAVRRALMRSVFLPKPYAWRYAPLSERPDPVTGRYFINEYDNEPW
jgi:hypothetical protein